MRRPICTLIYALIVLFSVPMSCIYGQSANELMQYETHIIKLNSSLDLSYYKSGAGDKTLILIHGLGSNKKAWLKLMPELSSDFTVYAIDLPKYLDSENADQISMTHFKNCVQLFIQELNIKSFYLCGHSMGGQVAIHCALNKLEGLEGLILVAPAGLEVFSDKDRAWFDTYITKQFMLSQNEARIKYNFDINFYGSSLPEDAQFMLDERLALMKDSIRFERYIDYTLACIKGMLNEPVHEQLSEIDIPTLVVYGANDMLIPNRILHPNLTVDNIKEAGLKIPKASAFLIPEAGHFLPWDQPKLLANKIKEHINEY